MTGPAPDANEGAVHVLHGSSSGLTVSGDQFLHQDTSGLTDQAETGDQFGRALSDSQYAEQPPPF